MSETITEMVLPGTYIEVRAEGLIGVAGIATGNLGVVGTALTGPVDKVVLLGSYAEAVATFGAYDAWSDTAGATPLTLTRTIEQLFRGGASTVYAVRIAGAAGAPTGPSEAGAGLVLLESQPVNLVVVGGLNVSQVSAQVLEHLERTENDGHERIAVLGTRSDDLTDIENDSNLVGNPRVVLVAPGIVAADAVGGNVNLPPSYAAALVAGRLSTLAPHVSPTNKDVAAAGLTRLYTRAEQKQLLDDHHILVLHQNLGFRILQGRSTDTGAFRQITTRRIVDYAKDGVRVGANPYLGKLNNARVRGALQATLDGFLSGMVLDEMLTGYDLAVTATRDQEINGIALVTMTLQPTFSIDFIKVIMNLS